MMLEEQIGCRKEALKLLQADASEKIDNVVLCCLQLCLNGMKTSAHDFKIIPGS